MESQAQWPRLWSALQDFKAEMPEVGLAGGCKKIKPLTDDEIFDIVLEKVRVAFPRINTTHLNSKGTKEELTTERVVDLLQIQESEVGLSGKQGDPRRSKGKLYWRIQRPQLRPGARFRRQQGRGFQWRRQQHTWKPGAMFVKCCASSAIMLL